MINESFARRIFIFILLALVCGVLMYSMVFESGGRYRKSLQIQRQSARVLDRWNAQMEQARQLEREGKFDQAIKAYQEVKTRFAYPAVEDGYLSDLAMDRIRYLQKQKNPQNSKAMDWTIYYDN